ncbi:hypothetical protein EDC94DRAFT_290284 [Helicostylum pulchrum]|nr:hypothetical protein EDC94DRAFT_290284 [Helicostylum pulchrum]
MPTVDEGGEDESSEQSETTSTAAADDNDDDATADNYVIKIRELVVKKLLTPHQTVNNIIIPFPERNNIKHLLYKKVYDVLRQDAIDFQTVELLEFSLSNIQT